MSIVLRFDQVSKQYRLGATRTSILTGLVKSIKNTLRPGAQQKNQPQILWAVRDVSFSLAQGDSLALVGKNGAGKSTILKLLANITRPTSGQIETQGRLSALIELGSGFHPDLTGRENIFLNGAVLGLSRDEIKRRFDEIVAFSEIEEFLDTPVKRYSSGMMVRLGFSVAACIEPDILLVDEVLAVGDASFRQKCLIRIKELLDKGTSLIFVSHNINMVEAVCKNALYIKSGKLVSQGDTREVITAYEKDLHDERAKKYLEASAVSPSLAAGDVQIETIELLDTNGSKPDYFLGEQSAEIQIQYISLRAEEPVDIVIRIIRSDGLTCCMMRTATDEISVFLNIGHGTFSVIIQPLQLIGGKYFIDAFISTPRDLVQYDNKRSNWFDVRGDTLSYEEQSGVFEPIHKWVVDPNLQSKK